jgi:hypothetical protein
MGIPAHTVVVKTTPCATSNIVQATTGLHSTPLREAQSDQLWSGWGRPIVIAASVLGVTLGPMAKR